MRPALTRVQGLRGWHSRQERVNVEPHHAQQPPSPLNRGGSPGGASSGLRAGSRASGRAEQNNHCPGGRSKTRSGHIRLRTSGSQDNPTGLHLPEIRSGRSREEVGGNPADTLTQCPVPVLTLPLRLLPQAGSAADQRPLIRPCAISDFTFK